MKVMKVSPIHVINKWMMCKYLQFLLVDFPSPFGQLPVLQVDGKALCQSNAIAAYVAREFGMYHILICIPSYLFWWKE